FVLFLVLTGFNVTGIREEPPQGPPAVAFTFNPSGAALLAALTRKNVPSGDGDQFATVKRHLAIILDGLVLSAPTINSEISSHGQIWGNFSEEELDSLVNIPRAGAGGGPILRPPPVEERALDDAKLPAAGGGTVLVYEIDPRSRGETQRDPT